MLGDSINTGSILDTIRSGIGVSDAPATVQSNGTNWSGITDAALKVLGLFRPSAPATTYTPPSFMDQYGTYVVIGGVALGAVVLLSATKKRRGRR